MYRPGFFTARQLAENQMVDLARANLRAASKVGRINAAPRVFRGLNGQPLGPRPSTYQTHTSFDPTREQRVAQSMQNGTFWGIRDKYNRDNPGMWMDNTGTITKHNPYIHGGQLGTGPTSVTPPRAPTPAATQSKAPSQPKATTNGPTGFYGTANPYGPQATAASGIVKSAANSAAASIAGGGFMNPIAAATTAAARSAAFAKGGFFGSKNPHAVPTHAAQPSNKGGRVFDNGVDVTADIQKGITGDRSGGFYGNTYSDDRMMSQAQHIQDAARGIAKAEAANREGQAKLAEIAKQNPYNTSATTPPVNSTPTQAPAVPAPAKPTPVAQTFAGDTRFRTGYQGPTPSYKQVAADTSAARPGTEAVKDFVKGTFAESDNIIHGVGAKIKAGADAFTSGVQAVKNMGPNVDDARTWLHGDPEAKKRLAAVSPTR